MLRGGHFDRRARVPGRGSMDLNSDRSGSRFPVQSPSMWKAGSRYVAVL